MLLVLHRMPLLWRTMARTLIAKVTVRMAFRASSTLVVVHSRRSESSLKGLLLRVRMQHRIMLVAIMLIPMALHGQSLLMSYARVVCGVRVGPSRRGWTTMLLVGFRSLFGIRKPLPSWWTFVRVREHADVGSVRTVADTVSALRPPRILLLQNLLLREIPGIVAICRSAVA